MSELLGPAGTKTNEFIAKQVHTRGFVLVYCYSGEKFLVGRSRSDHVSGKIKKFFHNSQEMNRHFTQHEKETFFTQAS